MTLSSASEIISIIKESGSLRIETDSFNFTQLAYHADTNKYVIERKFWSTITGQVEYETHQFSESEFQSYLSSAYGSIEEFKEKFNI
jgi:superoxide dismutase